MLRFALVGKPSGKHIHTGFGLTRRTPLAIRNELRIEYGISVSHESLLLEIFQELE